MHRSKNYANDDWNEGQRCNDSTVIPLLDETDWIGLNIILNHLNIGRKNVTDHE